MHRPRLFRSAVPSVFLWTCLLLSLSSAALAAGPSRAIPAKGLAAYVEYDGLDAHAEAWKATAACALFEKTPAGAMLADIARQVADHAFKGLLDHKAAGADLLAFERAVARQGFCLGLYDDKDQGVSGVAVLSGLGRKEARERLDRWTGILVRALSNGARKEPEGLRLRGRALSWTKTLVASSPRKDAKGDAVELVWWFEQEDLIVVLGPPSPAGPPVRAELVIDTLEGKASSVAVHPGRAAALAEGSDLKGFEGNGLFFIEAASAQARLAQFWAALEDAGKPYEGLTLPSGKYMHDDVKYLVPPPAEASGAKPASKPNQVAPAIPDLIPPPELPAPPAPPVAIEPKAPARDQAVAKAGKTSPVREPSARKKQNKKPMETGLDGITRIVGRWGFQGKALLADVRVEAPAPRKGLLRLIDQPRFHTDRLPAIPRDSRAFAVGSFDAAKTFETFVPFNLNLSMLFDMDNTEEDAGAAMHELELMVFELTGQRLREDLLGHLGPNWRLVAGPRDPKTGRPGLVPVLLVDLDDAKEFGKVLDSLAKRLNAGLRELTRIDDGKIEDQPTILALERLSAPDRGYRLRSPVGTIVWLGEGQEPTIMIGESHVAFAIDPAAARAALAAASKPEERWKPSGELVQAFEGLPAELTSLSVGDPLDSSWPGMLVYFPRLVQFVASTFEALEDRVPGSSPSAKFLGLLGVPQKGGFHLQITPDRVPRADAISAPLFPSVLATAVDDRGIRFISREAVPLTCVGPHFSYRGTTTEGESLVIDLRPFLFPSILAEVTYNLKEGGGRFSFRFWAKAVSDERSTK
jgi:hypothetical protein